MAKRRFTDRDVADINKRMRGKNSGFTQPILSDKMVPPTVTGGGLTSGSRMYRMCDGMAVSEGDVRNMQTFPQDYNFGKEDAKYVCGMSVPPVMMAQVASAIYEQWFRRQDGATES